MPDFATSIGKGIKKALSELNKTQKAVVLSGGIVVFVVLLFIVLHSTKGPIYEILWSNLDQIDAGAIVSELEKQGISYKLTDNGSTIKVPGDAVHRVRLSMATLGLPSSGIVGFEAIGSSGIWSTDFERRVQYIRAVSGELTRTIKALSGVEDARVHVALPDDTIFTSPDKTATASVLVKTAHGQTISQSSVRGIVNLVSRAVEGLTPDNVTVIDSAGNLLSKDAFLGSGQNIESPLDSVIELTFSTERELEDRLLNLLTRVLGPGNVTCQVHAELNMDQVKITDTTYESEPPGVLRSSQETTEAYQGSGNPPGGQAGALDVPSYGTLGEGESQYQRTETLRNFEVNEKVTETIVIPGAIKKLSVAVVVNKDLDEAETDMITETVTAALGLDPRRQDQISVSGLVFDTSLAHVFEESQETPERFPRIFVYAIAVAVAFIVGTVILIVARRRREDAVEVFPEPLSIKESAPTVSPEVAARQRSRENVERLTRTDPRLVATLIKSWLLEDEN